MEEVYIFNETHNITLHDYLIMSRGPKHLPLSVVVPITVIYLLIFFTGVLGNIAVCLVIVSNAAMHTATNYYLFSLAVSDLTLLLLGLPNDLKVYWEQYPWALGVGLCKFRALVSEMSSYTSVLTIVAFSMERFLAICHPLHAYTMSGLRRAVRIIAVLWIVSFIGASPFAVYTAVNYVDFPPGTNHVVPESAFCAMFEDNIPENFPIYELSCLLFFLIPMVIIIFLYVRIGLQIRKNSLGKSVDGTVHGETKKSLARKSILRMLVAVVITFFLCWAPFHTQRLLYVYARDSPHYQEINEWLYYITGCLYYFSSTVNPILYNLMSVKYRNAFRQLCSRKRRHRELNSSFRDTVVEHNKWQRATTWRGRSPQPTRDVVVTITPTTTGRGTCYTTVTAASKHWNNTLLRVTMGPDKSNAEVPNPQSEIDVRCESVNSLNKVCIQMETCI